MKVTNEKEEMKTLVAVSNKLQQDGFTENFVIDERGMHSMNSKKRYSPENVRIVSFFRFEGDSDPADNSIMYAIETSDGVKGSIADAYGHYADTRVTKFMTEVEAIMKKGHHEPYASE